MTEWMMQTLVSQNYHINLSILYLFPKWKGSENIVKLFLSHNVYLYCTER